MSKLSWLSELLKAHNYSSWSDEVAAKLMTEERGEVWLAIDPDTEVPASAVALRAWKKHNLVAYGFIFQSVHPDFRAPLKELKQKSGQDAWAALLNHYQKDTASYCLALRTRFYSLTWDPTTGVEKYLNELKDIVHDLTNINRTPEDDEVCNNFSLDFPHNSLPSVPVSL